MGDISPQLLSCSGPADYWRRDESEARLFGIQKAYGQVRAPGCVDRLRRDRTSSRKLQRAARRALGSSGFAVYTALAALAVLLLELSSIATQSTVFAADAERVDARAGRARVDAAETRAARIPSARLR